MSRNPCTIHPLAHPVQTRAKFLAGRDPLQLFADLRAGQRDVAESLAEDGSTEFSALRPKSNARKLFLDALPLSGAGSLRQQVRKSEKSLLFSFLGLDAGFDQIHKHSIGTSLSRLRDDLHVFSDPIGKRHALPN